MQLLKKQILQEIFLIPHTICDFDSLMMFKKKLLFLAWITTPNFSNERAVFAGLNRSQGKNLYERIRRKWPRPAGGMPKEPGEIWPWSRTLRKPITWGIKVKVCRFLCKENMVIILWDMICWWNTSHFERHFFCLNYIFVRRCVFGSAVCLLLGHPRNCVLCPEGLVVCVG